MKKALLAGACLLAGSIAGCGAGSVEGTYHNVANEKEYLELKKDGSFYLKAGAMDFSGKYAVEGKTITLNPTGRMAASGRVEKDMIIDNDGTRWKRR